MLRSISMGNWMCFRGEHWLDLQPMPYAITAQFETDQGRSNMGGKSALVEGINFAMTGRLAKHRKFDKEGWITKDTRGGYFQITLEDNSSIRRERKRNGRTNVLFIDTDGRRHVQSDAESAFLRHISLGLEDIDTVVNFEQDMMNRIVRMESEDRFKIVRAWLGLQLGEKAEKVATERLKTYTREVLRLRTQRKTIRDSMPVETKHTPVLSELEEALQKADADVTEWKAKRSIRIDLISDERLLKQYDALIEHGENLAEVVGKIAPDLEERLEGAEKHVSELHATYQAAKAETATKKKVSLGLFDGQCPVADIQCPATKRINSGREEAKEAFDAARKKEEKAYKAWQSALEAIAEVREEATSAITARSRLQDIRERARGMFGDVKPARKRMKAARADGLGLSLEDVDAKLEELERIRFEAGQAIAAHKAEFRNYKQQMEQLEGCETDLEKQEKWMMAMSVARTTFRAAQRRVAEGALEVIGTDANRMLRSSNIDLSIDIQWEREGKKYANACEMCGAPFPSSRKIKECEACGAERGQIIKQGLEFLRSKQSGAADDFAGLAMQLAAGSYLLRLRESSWAMAMVDEPFAKMDRTIRRAAAKQLLHLLGAGVYRQLFVISHAQDTVELYPGRINIHVANDEHRRIEIIT